LLSDALAERRDVRAFVAALSVTLLAVALGGWNRGFDATAVVMSPGSAWLVSADRGELTLLDTTSPAVVRHLPMATPGDLLTVGQGPTAYVLNGATGVLSRIDGRTFEAVAAPEALTWPGAPPTLLTTTSVLYVLDTANGVARAVDTDTFTPGELIDLPMRPPDGGVDVDDTGRVWITDAASRDVAWLADGMSHRLADAAPAPGAVVATTPGGPVLVSGSTGTVQQLTDSGSVRSTAHLPVRGDGIAVTGEDTNVVDVLIGSSGVLVQCALEAETCSQPIPLGSGADLLGRPVARDGIVFVPDQTDGSVIVVDPGRGAVVATPVAVNRAGAFELFAHDDAVVFNDPGGPDAGVVDADGTVHRVDKHARTAADSAPGLTPPAAVTQPPATPTSPPTTDRRTPESVTPTAGPTAPGPATPADVDRQVPVLTATSNVPQQTRTVAQTSTTTSTSTSGRPTTTSATTTPTTTSTTVGAPENNLCDRLGSGAALVDVDVTSAGNRSGLTFCPVLINDGDLPITGPYPVVGQVLGLDDGQQFTIVGKGDPDTCDAFGGPPVTGTFDQDITVDPVTGRWSFIEDLGYEESVTIARRFQIVTASPPSLAAIRTHHADWEAEHPGDTSGYPGMEQLPGDTTVLARFDAPAGEYPGSQPCTGG
jgi:hypothetical protein